MSVVTFEICTHPFDFILAYLDVKFENENIYIGVKKL